MLRISGIGIAALMVAGSFVAMPAQAATVGLVCDGVVQLVVAPTDEKANQCVAALSGNCEEGFRKDSGFFAFADSADGLAHGVGVGADKPSAAFTAIASCETQGHGGCSVSSSGEDDGSTFHSCE